MDKNVKDFLKKWKESNDVIEKRSRECLESGRYREILREMYRLKRSD